MITTWRIPETSHSSKLLNYNFIFLVTYWEVN